VNEPTIQLSGVRKSFLLTRALDGVTLDARAGITGLLGPNGAGKTTLLRIVATILAPDAGEVKLLGFDPAHTRERLAIRRRLGYMPQEPGFHRNFTAFEFVDYVAILKEMTERRPRHGEVRRVLQLVGMEGHANKKIRALSGGMRRRVALAQALLGDPELLVLDEPTAGLDPEQRLRFRGPVSSPARNGRSLLWPNQTEDVAALCSHLVVMHHGVVVLDGAPADLAAVATDKVWLAASREPGARLSWRTGEGLFRNIGDAPPGADLVEPTIEDGYLLLIGDAALAEAA